MHRRFHHILNRRHMGEEVETLEHHAYLRALRRDFLVVKQTQTAIAQRLVPNQLAFDEDLTSVRVSN
jgi:hypothetical protein